MLSAVSVSGRRLQSSHFTARQPIGTDVLIRSRLARGQLADRIVACAPAGFRLSALTRPAGRGRRADLGSSTEPLLWCCRFERTARRGASFTLDVAGLLDALWDAGIDWVRTEHRMGESEFGQ